MKESNEGDAVLRAFGETGTAPGPAGVNEALVERLSQVYRKPLIARAEHSLQPTPEAANSRVTRLRRKQRMLILRSRKGEVTANRIPPAPDPLAP
jgi:hypothetical protein